MQPDLAPAVAAILNRIIAVGGTTAHEALKSAETVPPDYIERPKVLTSVMAMDQGLIVGWQSVDGWQDHADIGTFLMPGVQARGIGAALFALTCNLARAWGLTAMMCAGSGLLRPAGLCRYRVRAGFHPERSARRGAGVSAI